MEWHWCSWGQWNGPFTLARINELTATMPDQFLMAGGGTDAQLEELRNYPRLYGLALVSPHITPAAVRVLADFPRLKELILCGLPINDAFVDELGVLKHLEIVTLVHPSCGSASVRRFMKQVPGCKVYQAGVNSILPASVRRDLTPYFTW